MSADALRQAVVSTVLDTRFGDYGNRTWMESAEAIADAVLPAVLQRVLLAMPGGKESARDQPDPWAWGYNAALRDVQTSIVSLIRSASVSSADLDPESTS